MGTGTIIYYFDEIFCIDNFLNEYKVAEVRLRNCKRQRDMRSFPPLASVTTSLPGCAVLNWRATWSLKK